MTYLAISGGKDSVAMALLMHERGEEFELVFADTGAELPETYWTLPRVAQYVGRRLNSVSSGTFFQNLLNNGFILPSPTLRWCTQTLKQVPQLRFYQGVKAEAVCVGIRGDERQRANLSASGLGYEYRYPLVEAGMGRRDVFTLCDKHGLLSPAYTWRSSTSCFCCPFQRKYDWKGMLKHHPSLYALAEDWEDQCAVYMAAKGLKQKPHTWMDGISLEGFRKMTDAQLELFPEREEEACTICKYD